MESIRGGAPAVRDRARRRSRRTPTGRARARGLVSATACLGLVLTGATAVVPVAAQAAVAPTGQGLTITPGDLKFILKQIKIAEHHAATQTPSNMCGTLIGPAADQIPDRLTSFGLRTVDGSCNNLFASRETFAAADQAFPRLTSPVFRPGEDAAPFGPPGPTSYANKNSNVVDSQPRTVSNLVVDQTSTNPAAIAAAAFPVRTQQAPGKFPCTTDPKPLADPPVEGFPANCVPSHQTLFTPNVTTDVGLSPPYNSLFTFFGQFFDHGVDQTVKSGSAVFVPLKADDPLVTLGPDGAPGTGDEVPASQRFMVLTRAQNDPGPDGVLGNADDLQNATNTDSPWVDQSQTYTSHSAHQVFLREYVVNSAGRPVSTGRLLGGEGNGASGMATWATVKAQAASLLGLKLLDRDVTNIPLIAADPYGKFIPGPDHGLPQYVTTGPDGRPNTADDVLVEGDTVNPVPVPDDALHFDTPFLTDIAHNADPSPVDTDHNPGTPPVPPIPDADHVASADFASQPPGTYDDEMLDAHFCAGDGRVNENIALTTIHQIFHSEHDRLVEYVKGVLTADTTPSGVAALAEWKLATGTPDGWNGERLFQAARFVTEMEYQHLVFEEFARKVQPAVKPFHVYQPDINPAIPAEFAHAVYRFGHSMLDDTVARRDEDPATFVTTDNSLPLLKAFLNPPEYFNSKTATPYTPEQAAGSIVMGSSDQVGNELDEFVTETLRNNLLGLPLDLATLNMARAREAGVPPLNDLRRQLFAKTHDGQLTPYSDWSDFGQHLKHPESLINFVAAYGHHPSITSKTTLAGKRAAAKAIVDPTTPPASDPGTIPDDAAAFMFGTGAWADDSKGVTTTGVDDVDLWVGGLAEITNVFGGILGSTFNYVFQNTLEDLQEGDRLYYLARTPGLNLRAQLEGNSFAELIQRNTDGTHSLKADAFATADCRFELKNLAGTAADFATLGSTVADDPGTPCNEAALLIRKADGTIQYRQFNSVDPSGINGQAVYNGTPNVDRVFGGNDNDTFWGGAGNDVLEGNGGDDVTLGGDGNDRITDLAGADVLKGGPGNDALDGGPGDDIPMGGDGADFINGGANDNESFAGEGNDFVLAGQGADAVFAGGGDDWIEGGAGQDLLIGDHGAPFFDDPGEVQPGNDVFVGQVGENDYDAEGGDDIMSQNAAIDRNAGSGGFDWAIHQYDTVGADDDMAINNNLLGLPLPIVVNRDRWQETEANSGSAFNDVIRGDDDVPSDAGGAGFTGCDVLDQTGVNRVAGLATLLPQPLTGSLAPVLANSQAGDCPLTGPIWGEGNILLGGLGSDKITGRGADDVIDGDRALTVRISVRTNPADPATEIGTTDLMERQYLRDANGALTGPTLQAAVFAGTVDPGDLVLVREIRPVTAPAADCGATAPVNCDTAVFLGPFASYDVKVADGVVTVNQTGALGTGQKVSDGIDTLRNVEALQFADQTVRLGVPNAPTAVTAVAADGSANVSWTGASFTGGLALTGQEVVVSSGGSVVQTVTVPAAATTAVVTGLTNGTAYTFQVRAVNALGKGPLSAASASVTPRGAPTAPTNVVATTGNALAHLSWAAAGANGAAVTGYRIQVIVGTTVRTTVTVSTPVTTFDVTGLTNGTTYTFRVQGVNLVGPGALSVASNTVVPGVPGAPGILAPAQGPAGGTLTAVANWAAPTSAGAANVNGYTVSALRMDANGTTVVGAPVTNTVGAGIRTATFTLPAGSYRFEVVATNRFGTSVPSARSALIAPR
jgi:Ca2+-binding RTX toxin-like protein